MKVMSLLRVSACIYHASSFFCVNDVFYHRTDFRSEDSNLVFQVGSPNSSQNAVPSYSKLLIIRDPFSIPTFVRRSFFEMSSLHPQQLLRVFCI